MHGVGRRAGGRNRRRDLLPQPSGLRAGRRRRRRHELAVEVVALHVLHRAAAGRGAQRSERVRDRLERRHVRAAAAADVRRGRGRAHDEDAVAREVGAAKRQGAARVLQERRALLRDVLRDREVGRHQRLQVRPLRHERACSSPPQRCSRRCASRRACPRAGRARFIEVRMRKTAVSSAAAHCGGAHRRDRRIVPVHGNRARPVQHRLGQRLAGARRARPENSPRSRRRWC